MRTRFLVMLLFGLMAAAPLTTHAQGNGSSERIQAAIDRINELVPGIGEPDLVPAVIENPTDNINLGCAIAPSGPLGRTIQAFRVELRYGDTSYIFYVSEDATLVVDCQNVPSGGPSQQLATLTPTPGTQLFCVLRSDNNALVYAQPGRASVVIGSVQRNRVYNVAAQVQDGGRFWYRIVYRPGQAGWVLSTTAVISGQDCARLPLEDHEIARPAAPTATNTALPTASSPATASSSATPTPFPTAPIVGLNCPADFTGFLPSQLALSDRTAAVASGAILTVRTNPDPSSADIGRIVGGDVAFVGLLEGPSCSNGVVWWQVDAPNVQGWVPESSQVAGQYFLLPLPREADASTPNGDTPPLALVPVAADNATTLSRQAQAEVDGTRLAVSDTLAAIITDSGVQFFDLPDLTAREDLRDALPAAASPLLPTAIAFDRYGDFLAIGYDSGAMALLEIEQAIWIALTVDEDHPDPVTSIAFDADNRRMLSVSASSALIWDLSDTSFNAATGDIDLLLRLSAQDDGPLYDGVFTRRGTPVLRANASLLTVSEGGSVGQTFSLAQAMPGRLLAVPPAIAPNEDSVWFDADSGIGSFDAASNRASYPAVLAAGTLPPTRSLGDDFDLLLRSGPSSVALLNPDDNTTVAVVEFASALNGFALTPDGRLLVLLDGAGLGVWGVEAAVE